MSPLSAFRRRIPAPDGMSWPHVVIIGGGFAGANAALELRDARVRVTLIDRNIYKTFQPLLYQVATGGLNPGDVTMVLRGLSRKAPNLRVRQGDVVGVDPQRRIVSVEDGGAQTQQISFDHLIIANGISANYFGTTGARRHAMPMYTRARTPRPSAIGSSQSSSARPAPIPMTSCTSRSSAAEPRAWRSPVLWPTSAATS